MKSSKEIISTEPRKQAFEACTVIVFYFNQWHSPGNDCPIQGLQNSDKLKERLLSRLETSLVHKIITIRKTDALCVIFHVIFKYILCMHFHLAKVSQMWTWHFCDLSIMKQSSKCCEFDKMTIRVDGFMTYYA